MSYFEVKLFSTFESEIVMHWLRQAICSYFSDLIVDIFVSNPELSSDRENEEARIQSKLYFQLHGPNESCSNAKVGQGLH